MARRAYGEGEISPNHQFRRDEIIDVAARLLRSGGVSGCTVRDVATATGVSTGVVHYYFDDIYQLRDLAYERLTSTYFEGIRAAVAEIDDPVSAFWHTISAYLTPWGEHRSMPLLWAEYYVSSLSADRLSGPATAFQATIDLFRSALRAVDPGLERTAPALFRHTNGAVTSQTLVPVSLGEFIGEASLLTGVRPPDGAHRCTDPLCRLCFPSDAAPE